MELNKIYCMDNLALMNKMEHESVDLIYCDILYGTGRKFEDYQDLKPIKKEIEEFYIPRLQEMCRILKSTGSIYLQMDWHIDHWVRSICDDIFGYDNFRNQIVWHYSGIKRATAKKFPQKHDVILSYSKSDNYIWNVQYKPHKKEYLKRFKPDETGRLCRTDVNPTKGGSRKIYLDEVKGDIVDSVWADIPQVNPMARENYRYNTQKPRLLLERIIESSTNKNDVVADFFCGSGTTLDVAKRLGRNYIGCDINPRAIEIANERLSKTI